MTLCCGARQARSLVHGPGNYCHFWKNCFGVGDHYIGVSVINDVNNADVTIPSDGVGGGTGPSNKPRVEYVFRRELRTDTGSEYLLPSFYRRWCQRNFVAIRLADTTTAYRDPHRRIAGLTDIGISPASMHEEGLTVEPSSFADSGLLNDPASGFSWVHGPIDALNVVNNQSTNSVVLCSTYF